MRAEIKRIRERAFRAYVVIDTPSSRQGFKDEAVNCVFVLLSEIEELEGRLAKMNKEKPQQDYGEAPKSCYCAATKAPCGWCESQPSPAEGKEAKP